MKILFREAGYDAEDISTRTQCNGWTVIGELLGEALVEYRSNHPTDGMAMLISYSFIKAD